MSKQVNIYIFIIVAISIAFLRISQPYTGLNQAVLNVLFGWGFLGLLLINILLFLNSMFGSIQNLRNEKDGSPERKDKKTEKILGPILQGSHVFQSKMPFWANLGITICIGLIAGSVLGWLICRIIELKFNNWKGRYYPVLSVEKLKVSGTFLCTMS